MDQVWAGEPGSCRQPPLLTKLCGPRGGSLVDTIELSEQKATNHIFLSLIIQRPAKKKKLINGKLQTTTPSAALDKHSEIVHDECNF